MAIDDWEYKTVDFAGRKVKVAQEKENASVSDEHIAEATLKYEERFRLEHEFLPILWKHFKKLLRYYKQSVAIGVVPVVPQSMVAELEKLLEAQYHRTGDFLQELDYSKRIAEGASEEEANGAKGLFALALVAVVAEILPAQTATIVSTTNKSFQQFYARAVQIEVEAIAGASGVSQTATIADTASGLVQKSFKNRVKQIATTETGHFMHRGTLAAPDKEDLIEAGVIDDDVEVEVLGTRVKQWITKLDKRVRATHRAMHGVTIPSTENFIVDGTHQMICPEDPLRGAPAKEICNCRCEFIKFRSVAFKESSNN